MLVPLPAMPHRRTKASPARREPCQQTAISYDGYGRLQTKHVPEQQDSSGNPAYTTYSYNPDDTIYSVTDVRGASATYGYNNRHLVTSINYSAPTGITPTANVTFGYDAAGNRTSMTDGLGGQSYSYDQLSRMSSETRTIAGVGSFTLGYTYNAFVRTSVGGEKFRIKISNTVRS